MTSYRIEIDLTPLQLVIQDKTEAVAAVANAAVRQTAEDIRAMWQEQVFLHLPCRDAYTQERRTAAVESIHVDHPGPFHSVVSSNNQAVREVEEGVPERDLKLMLGTSTRTKVSKEGKRYLTIPFRHGTQGGDGGLSPAMPEHVRVAALMMGQSRVTGQKLRINAHGQQVPQSVYQWDRKGDAIARGKRKLLSIGALPEGLAPKLLPSHKTDPYAGMRRMAANSPGAKSSVYLTFRVMSEDSTGWIVPAKPGQFVARDIVAQGRGMLSARIRELLREIGV